MRASEKPLSAEQCSGQTNMSQIQALQKGWGSRITGETKGEGDQPGQPSKSPVALESKQKMSCRAEARTWEEEIAVLPWRSACQRLCKSQRGRFPLKVEATCKDAVMEGSAQASLVAKSRAWGSARFHDSRGLERIEAA